MPEPITERLLAEWEESARKSAYFTLTGEMIVAMIAEIRRLRAENEKLRPAQLIDVDEFYRDEEGRP